VNQHRHPRQKLARHRRRRQPEEVLDLRGSNEQRDAIGKPDDDGARNIFDRCPEAGEAHHNQQYTRHHPHEGETREAKFRNDARNNDDEGAGGPPDLCA
jgi:hypothetical protein